MAIKSNYGKERVASAVMASAYTGVYLWAAAANAAGTVDPNAVADAVKGREYHDAMQRYAPSVADSPTTSTVWTAGALLREVSRALPGTVTSADFFPRLYAIRNNTLGGLVGPLTFNEGKAASAINCVFRLKVAGQHFTAPDGSQPQCF